MILAEKDCHGDVLWTWTFPTISSNQRSLFLEKCCLRNGNSSQQELLEFTYGQFQQKWYYIYTRDVHSDVLRQVGVNGKH